MALTKRPDQFMATDLDGETVLLDLHGGELFALDGTAQAIWQALDTAGDEEELVARLAERYDGDRGEITADVRALLRELRTAGLVG